MRQYTKTALLILGITLIPIPALSQENSATPLETTRPNYAEVGFGLNLASGFRRYRDFMVEPRGTESRRSLQINTSADSGSLKEFHIAYGGFKKVAWLKGDSWLQREIEYTHSKGDVRADGTYRLFMSSPNPDGTVTHTQNDTERLPSSATASATIQALSFNVLFQEQFLEGSHGALGWGIGIASVRFNSPTGNSEIIDQKVFESKTVPQYSMMIDLGHELSPGITLNFQGSATIRPSHPLLSKPIHRLRLGLRFDL